MKELKDLTREEYEVLKTKGLLYEYYVEATGCWFKDCKDAENNPPFASTEDFVDKSLSLCSNLLMFNRATVLETKDRSKKHLSKEWPLKKFWSFGNRVSCTKGVDKKPTANAVWYGWFEYKTSYTGEPEIGWLFSR